MNTYPTPYKPETRNLDTHVVIQEIRLVRKLYNGLKAIADAENITVEEVVVNFMMGKESCFDHPNYPK